MLSHFPLLQITTTQLHQTTYFLLKTPSSSSSLSVELPGFRSTGDMANLPMTWLNQTDTHMIVNPTQHSATKPVKTTTGTCNPKVKMMCVSTH
ncbi:hypothetical protein KC19_1G141600 [Ceratodon purpureus]|uniref:Uncharacterized protein n=1 Tax=Ceratodon purpureus TaxID=3225 RepID=A0A8T0J5X9_CERPU|nr:hypothetical protein KC19_1G141600 [Ceratodon purpureus]